MPQHTIVQQSYQQQMPSLQGAPHHTVQMIPFNLSHNNTLRYNTHPSQYAKTYPANFNKKSSNKLSQSSSLLVNTITTQHKILSNTNLSEHLSFNKPQSYLPDIQLVNKGKSAFK